MHTRPPHAVPAGVSALRRLADHPPNRARIVEQGGLEPLTKAGLSVHLETQREVAAAFNSLTLNDDNKGQIARHGAMGTLVHLCQSPDVECARHAIGAMANIAEDLGTHAIIGEKGGGAFLIGLMHHSNVDVHRCVWW